jgi:D-galactose 1-dehydrogenase
MRPLRIAIVGFGKIAADQHVPAIVAHPRFELAGTVSRNGKGPIPSFKNHRELLRSIPDLDAVAITTPPSVRYTIARECIEAGLHVLLEKPPAATLGEIEDLACLAEGKQVTLFTTWHAQHNPSVAAAASALAGKQIATMDIVWHEDVRKWHPGQEWIWEPGGFGVFDPGINAFSIVTKIFPGPLFVHEAELLFPDNRQTPIAVNLRFASPVAEGGLSCSLDWRHSGDEAWTVAFRTRDGMALTLSEGGSKLEIDGEHIGSADPREYPDIYAEFIDLIDARRSRVDVAPLRLVADAFLLGKRTQLEPFLDERP